MEHSLWGIVLAGGEGIRLRHFVRQHLGTDAPKQFCAFVGTRTMVEHTVQRAETIMPPEHLLIVATAHQREHVAATLGNRPPNTILLQPEGRDTGPGILLPLSHIVHRDPQAFVAIFPSDHFVMPGETLMNAVLEAAQFLSQSARDRIALLTVEPTEAETEYGWVVPGPPACPHHPSDVRTVERFVEKPSREDARRLMADGGLWNTMVLVGRASALLSLVRRTCPQLAAYFSLIQRSIGTPQEADTLATVYAMVPSVNFSTAVLARCSEDLLVRPVRGMCWSDWGRAERILATLAWLGLPPLAPGQRAEPCGATPEIRWREKGGPYVRSAHQGPCRG